MAAARTPAALLAAASVTRARRKPRSFPGKFALTLGISGQGALALALEGVWRKTAREDAAALGGVSRDPAFPLCALGEWRSRCWGSAYFGPNFPSMDSVSLGESLNFSRFSPMQNGQSYAHSFETGI